MRSGQGQGWLQTVSSSPTRLLLVSGVDTLVSRFPGGDGRVGEPCLLSLQVLNEETSGCKEGEKLSLATTAPKKPPAKRTRWNILKCAYMMVTFLFVSYNKGDWCYCHYCNTEEDIRTDPCCSF
ncbi:epididymal protein 13 [Meles meles]|uniref:epididymal protein 13 n=1 Tax=Meles meles TaxID=9662 RepID=UPI001E69C6D5|nr:epididymal protein 13 [Meles meles]